MQRLGFTKTTVTSEILRLVSPLCENSLSCNLKLFINNFGCEKCPIIEKDTHLLKLNVLPLCCKISRINVIQKKVKKMSKVYSVRGCGIN